MNLNFKLRLLKMLDATMGRLLALLLPSPSAPAPDSDLRSILIIRPGGIGDALLLLPVLARLSNCYPCAVIDVLAEQRNAGVFRLSPAVATVWRYDLPGELVRLFRRRFDLIIDTEQWYCLSAVVARLLCPSRHIGFSGNGRDRLLTDVVTYDTGRYELLMFQALLEPLGCGNTPIGDGEYLQLPEAAREQAAGLLAPMAGKQLVAIFPGASVPEKRWPAERFMTIAKAAADCGYPPVVVGGPGEVTLGEQIIAGAGAGINCAGRTSLAVTMAVLARSSLLITGDSGLLHAAALLKISVVALFGPSNPQKWAPRGSGRIVVRHDPGCAPCSHFGTIPPCPDNACCMGEISVDEVLAAVMQCLRPDGQEDQQRKQIEAGEE